MRFASAVVGATMIAGMLLSPAGADAQRALDPHLLAAFTYRNVGPFRMQARIADIDVPASPEKRAPPARAQALMRSVARHSS